jgi:Ankyrin repeats (3 copies)
MTEDFEGHNALDWAASAGNVNVIEYLIRRGLHPSRVDPLGRTALHAAASAGKISAIEFLIRCGCDPNLQDKSGQSPVSIASSFPLFIFEGESTHNRHGTRAINGVTSGQLCIIRKALLNAMRVKPDGQLPLNLVAMSPQACSSECGVANIDVNDIPILSSGHDNSDAALPSSQNLHSRQKRHSTSSWHFLIPLSFSRSSLSRKSFRDWDVGEDVEVGRNTGRGGNGNYFNNNNNQRESTSRQCEDTVISSTRRKQHHHMYLYSITRTGSKRPHALCRLRPSRSRFVFALPYSLLVIGYWILTICIPFYAWALLTAITIWLLR